MHYEVIDAELDLGDLGLREAEVHVRWIRYLPGDFSINITAILVRFQGSGTPGGPPTEIFNAYPHLNDSRLKAIQQIVENRIRNDQFGKHRSEGEVLPDVVA